MKKDPSVRSRLSNTDSPSDIFFSFSWGRIWHRYEKQPLPKWTNEYINIYKVIIKALTLIWMIMLWADLPRYSFPCSDLIPVKNIAQTNSLFNWTWWTKNFANHCCRRILNWLHCGKTVLLLYIAIVCLVPRTLREREREKEGGRNTHYTFTITCVLESLVLENVLNNEKKWGFDDIKQFILEIHDRSVKITWSVI